ncbi:MAG: glycosyltransferase family 4 protein [Pseudomonadota bacterium]|nr:glycosyltransferase family 4 protein [Pseudomonadota bacterium]
MRILHCLSQIPGKTGSGVYLQAIVREAALNKIEQAVVCGLPAAMPLHESKLEIAAENIFAVRFETEALPFPVAGMSDVMPYPSTCFSTFESLRLNQYKAAFGKTLSEAVSKFSPDLIHTHHLWIMTALVKKLFPEIPVVTSVHGTELRQLKLAKQLTTKVIKGVSRVDKVMVLNHDQHRQVVKEYDFPTERVVLTGTGYRQDLFCRSICAKEKLPTIIYAGKLSRAKGVPWLLEAFAKLKEKSVLWLAGSGGGPEAETIRRQASCNPNVELLGALSQTELAARFQRAHILVLPSFFEGLPLVLLEALACDCRVVVTDLPGIRELVSDEAIAEGLVSCLPIPPLTGPDTLETMHEKPFLNNLEKALSEQIKRIKEQQFICCHNLQKTLDQTGWHQVFKRVEKVYNEVIHPTPE